MASNTPPRNTKLLSNKCCTCCNMWCWRAFKWLPVLLIVSIVLWSYYAYVVQLCILTVENIEQKCIYLVLYHLLFLMFAWSYFKTIFGRNIPIPDMYKLPEGELEKLLSADSEEAQRALLENCAKDLPILTRTMSGAVRYCNRCVIIKPDRAHHCSICARCVLKMDHHCPWVNNCVGFSNYKFFVLFLGYALLYCFYIIATSLAYFIKFWKGEFGMAVGAGRYHIVFVFFVAMMFALSLGSLFGYHVYLVCNNRTTLEAFRSPVFRGGADKKGFSLGCYRNFKEVFGTNPNLWMLPIFSSVGDGCVYPVRREHQLATFNTQQDHSYDSMGTTHPRSESDDDVEAGRSRAHNSNTKRNRGGDGLTYPEREPEEDMESLLSSERWERWGERATPYDENLETSSYDEL